MDRDDEHQKRNDDCPDKAFPWVKAHRRPGGGRAALVVYRVAAAEQRRTVHPPVRPVTPCVVDQQIEQHRTGPPPQWIIGKAGMRSEEHTSELQSLMRIPYAVFCLKQKNTHEHTTHH